MKKVILICICLLLMLLCGCSNEHSEGDWVYTVKDGNAYLTNYKNRSEQIIIPDKIGKYAVVGLGENLFVGTQTEVQNVVIPNTVTTIGVKAFANCKNLNSITIPESVKKIEAGAFYNCSNLSNITFEGDIFNVSKDAFSSTAWYNNKPDGVIYIGKVAYASKGNYDTCYIKTGTTHIKFGEVNFKTIHIPNTVVEIMPYAFANSRVENVYISDGDSKLAIGDYAFSKCNNIKQFNFPKRLETIGAYAFEYTTFGGVTIPNNILNLGEGAFSNCSNLKYVTIEGNIKELPDKLLYYCKELENVTVGEGVEYIGMRAFSQCPKLLNVSLPESLKRMASNAFWMKKWDEPETIHIIAKKGTYGEVFAHNHGFVFVEEGQQ